MPQGLDSVREGAEVTFEQIDDLQFAHVWIRDGRIFGKAAWLRATIPIDTVVTVPSSMQPAVTWYLTKHCGFLFVEQREIDGDVHDVLLKVV